jgi:type II secretory pathway pseudopilin PulG
MKHKIEANLEAGFSLMELLVCMVILIPLMVAAISLFSTGIRQQGTEQSSIDVNQEARSGLEMMTREISQAGSHRDRRTNTTSGVNSSQLVQSVNLSSTVGITVGDWVDIDTDTNSETVQATQVTANSISGIFKKNHNAGVPVNLFAQPYVWGVIPPTGTGPNASVTVTKLRFFGDIDGDVNSGITDPNLYYIEYDYDSVNNQITRSATPITTMTKGPAIPLIRNVKPNSVQFTINTNGLGFVSSVSIAMTVQNNWRTASKLQEMELSSRALVPSVSAGTALVYELQQFQDFNTLPPVPNNVVYLASH